MKISEMRLRILAVPFVEPAPWRFGRLMGITSILVELRTDDGLVGLGEAPGIPAPDKVRRAIEAMRPQLVGADATEVLRNTRTASERLDEPDPRIASVALAAVEMALWDIRGKTAGLPVHRLWGGPDFAPIPFYWHVNAPELDPAEVADRAELGLDEGFTTLYLKVGFGIDRDLELAQAIRSRVGPEVPLRLDPNEGWTPPEVSRRVGEIEALGLEFLEQPFPAPNHVAAAELRRSSRIPVAANQSAWLLDDVREVLARDAADIVVTGIHQLGGMIALRDAAVLCRSAGVPLVRHSLCDLGIATAAAMQVLATLPSEQLAHQTHLTLVESDLVTPSWRFAAGSLRPPERPGLGVELDQEAVSRYERRYAEEGAFDAFGEPHPSTRAGLS
jgi:L-alanine-DL-glutamate epimerase-like enolase superfamily enzyme